MCSALNPEPTPNMSCTAQSSEAKAIVKTRMATI